jgi:CheY-like chemotaxis protein
MKFLIVDDSAQMRRLLCSVLQGVATEVAECTDGCDALAAYDTHLPDWVLMDIEMNRMDGLTATAEITSAHPEARILVVTNHDSAALRNEAARVGACGYVLKDNLLDLRRMVSA